MQLEVGYNSRLIPASEQGIPYAIRNLPGVDEDNSFVIISDDEGCSMKVTGGGGIFQLEYFEKYGRKHLWADYELYEHDVVEAFMSFWKQDGKYRKNITWRRDWSTLEIIQLVGVAVMLGIMAFWVGIILYHKYF